MAILKKANKERYTVVDMNIVRDKRLSLKDLGLLVQLLSLPDNWRFSEKGLEKIFEQDGQTAIRTAIKHLEDFRYLKRNKLHDSNGKFIGVEWCVFETPYKENSSEYNLQNPYLENPNLVNPNLEKPAQYNTNKVITHLSNIQSQSQGHSQHEIENQIDNDNDLTKKNIKKSVKEKPSLTPNQKNEISFNTAKKLFQQNIEYESLILKFPHQSDLIDELLYCMLDVYLSNSEIIKINGKDKNMALVKSVYSKINSTDIEHIISQYEQVRHKIIHVNAYLKTMLFTCKQETGHFYTNAVRADGMI